MCNMAVVKYVILSLSGLSYLNYVFCEPEYLDLPDGSPCTTKGVQGVCMSVFRCYIAAVIYIYANGGRTKGIPDLPDICSYKNNHPVVCCTDCRTFEDERYKNYRFDPNNNLIKKTGQAAFDKCLDYYYDLPYPCRGGVAGINVVQEWNATNKCFDNRPTYVLVSGGRDAQRWEFPHMALIGYGESRDSAQWLCGGSVISERFIITAAHCSSSRALGSIKYAALGLLKRTDPKEYWKIHDIKRIIKHPEYKSPAKYHDIALLETEKEIFFGKDLLPACLNTRSGRWTFGEVAGWGRTGPKHELANTLQVVYVDEYNETDCSELYEPHRLLKQGYDHEKQMCFGSKTDIVDTCEGDSGGPLQRNDYKCLYTVIGITSYGRDCGTPGNAGMYTRISFYVPWIESVVWPDYKLE